MKDFKYLFAYTIPLSAYASFMSFGVGTYITVLYAFVIIPLLDSVLKQNKENLDENQISDKKINKVFDWMLYINLPIVFVLLWVVFNRLENIEYSVAETIGILLSAGILLATNAINVAHELCHRKKYYEKFIGKALFMPCLYMHFYIEHNFGHHINVATSEDGATAKYKQSLYSFWLSSVTKQYIDAWKKQKQL